MVMVKSYTVHKKGNRVEHSQMLQELVKLNTPTLIYLSFDLFFLIFYSPIQIIS